MKKLKNDMKRIAFASFLLVASLVCSAGERPNIVLVLADDIGTGWIPPYAERLTPEDIEPEVFEAYKQTRGHLGSINKEAHIKAASDCMPFLSKLAEDGAVFDRCFATAALCAPSRAGLLTGSFQQSWGAYWNKDVDDHGIPAERVIIAEPLKEAGYRCGMVGKWHVAKKDRAIMERIWVEELGQTLPIPNGYKGLWPQLAKALKGSGYVSSSISGQHPLDRGFDYYFGYNSHDDDDYESRTLWEDWGLVPQRPKGEFLTELFNEKSCAFIDSSLQEKQPFFLYYAPKTLHGAISKPPVKYSSQFNTGNRFTDEYAGHMLALDEGLQQIFQTLEKHGELENTLFVFSCDNGCTLYNVPPYNAPNRGGKGTGWMGGLNVPFVVWQAGMAQTGINTEIASLADVMPTVLEAAGVQIPEGIDGKSLLPYLQGKTDSGPRESLGSASIQSSRWSYCYEADGENNKKDAEQAPLYAWYLEGDRMLMRTTAVRPGLYEALPEGLPAQTLLFDLSSDRQQRNDLSAQYPEQVQRFDRGIHDWLSGMAVPISSQKADYQELLKGTEK